MCLININTFEVTLVFVKILINYKADLKYVVTMPSNQKYYWLVSIAASSFIVQI